MNVMVSKQSLRSLSLFFLAVAVSVNSEPPQKCNPSGCPQPEITTRSCLDYLKRGFKKSGHYQVYDFKADIVLTVYCDMSSEAGAAWTLIESFALKNKNLEPFYKHPLSTNAPVNEKSPNWNLYRMSLSQMSSLKSQSTHWRATCGFPTYGVDLYTDYVRAKFADFNIMTFLGYGICKKVEYVNIRGHQCVQCTSKWWQVKDTYGPTIDSSQAGCQFVPTQGSVYSEDNFGYPMAINKKFRCTSSSRSTTNWWFGGYLE